jgi:NADPH:quinone reductase-like Zn-dependent oxidoreductase
MHGFGEPRQARLGEIAVPDIGPNDLLVRIGAVSLNPVDWKEVAGLLVGFYPPYPSPWVPGFDGSGVVERVGEGIAGFAPGDRVLVRPDRPGLGVLAEFARVAPARAVKMPGALSHAEIACLATALRTAYQGFTRPDVGILQPGQSVFVDGASGGVGGYAVALGKAMGLKVAASCRPANADYVRSLGAELIVDYRARDVLDRLRGWMPGGVNAILDCNNGGQKSEMLDVLAPGGRLIALATLNNDADPAAVAAQAQAKGKEFHFLLMDYDRLAEDMAGLAPILKSGAMTMPAITIYPFDRAVEALEAVKAGGVRGKIAIEIARLH